MLGGVFLLLSTILWLQWCHQKTRTQESLFSILEQYHCAPDATLPCKPKKWWDILSWDNTYTMTNDTLFLSPKHHTRTSLIRQLIAQGFTGFITIPYPTQGNSALSATGLGDNYEVLREITWTDMIDDYFNTLQEEDVFSGTQIFSIPKDTRKNRTGIYLFKNTDDLRNIWYQVVSHRSRHNTDKEYRRYNIAKSFELFQHVQIILPWATFAFLDKAKYDEYIQKNYKKWYVIVEWEEIQEYGGGICGASTAVYQGILTNKNLKRTHRRPHTKWFSNLYPATINGQYIAIPGIDSAIYANQIDLQFRNISNHPIILVANYDGSYDSEEQVFTLWYPYDQGSFEFLHGWYIRHDEPAKEGTGVESVRWGCYTRNINGEEKRNCYQEVH